MAAKASRLLERTRELIEESGLCDREIHERTGYDLTWIWRIRTGRAVNPGAASLEDLYTKLGGTGLEAL